jgi:hypothetical protein
MPCGCGEKEYNPDPVLSVLMNIRSARSNLLIAKDLVGCPYCKQHVQECIDKVTELENFAELGRSWDLGSEPAWKIVLRTIRAIAKTDINLVRAGLYRLRLKIG